MNHQDHVNLIRAGIPAGGGIWADLGSGTGAFALALADVLGGAGEVYSIDKDGDALREQEHAMHARFPDTVIHYSTADFAAPLDVPPLDGVIMANALHFMRDKSHVLQSIKNHLRPNGRLVLVEYNADQGNMWVPYPLSYPTWQTLSKRCGFVNTKLLATVPSRFLREIYSALSLQS